MVIYSKNYKFKEVKLKALTIVGAIFIQKAILNVKNIKY